MNIGTPERGREMWKPAEEQPRQGDKPSDAKLIDGLLDLEAYFRSLLDPDDDNDDEDNITVRDVETCGQSAARLKALTAQNAALRKRLARVTAELDASLKRSYSNSKYRRARTSRSCLQGLGSRLKNPFGLSGDGKARWGRATRRRKR